MGLHATLLRGTGSRDICSSLAGLWQRGIKECYDSSRERHRCRVIGLQNMAGAERVEQPGPGRVVFLAYSYAGVALYHTSTYILTYG